MQKVSELKKPPVVGEFYLVPCVWVNRSVWMPIVGSWHSDAELGVDNEHYHFDVRFVPDEELTTSPKFSSDVSTLGALAMNIRYAYHEVADLVPILKRRKCRRTMPEMPVDVPHRNGFQKPFIGRKVLCGKCPHRGFPLESLPQDENGHVICNGHGLKIDMRKGEVIER